MEISSLSAIQAKAPKSLEHKFSTTIRNLFRDCTVYLDAYTVLMDATWAVEYEPDSLVKWVPTPFVVVREMLELARVCSKDIVYDLGCGDGRMLFTAVQEFGAHKAVEYEIRQDLYESSKQEIQHQNLQNQITMIKGNLLDADLSGASVIVLYLSPKANERLRPKLEDEAKPGTRIVSYDFQIDRWFPDKKVQLGEYPFSERSNTKALYMYTVP